MLFSRRLVLDCRNKRHLVRRRKQASKAAGKEGGPAAHPLPGNAAPLLPPPHPQDRAIGAVACVVGEGKCLALLPRRLGIAQIAPAK